MLKSGFCFCFYKAQSCEFDAKITLQTYILLFFQSLKRDKQFTNWKPFMFKQSYQSPHQFNFQDKINLKFYSSLI